MVTCSNLPSEDGSVISNESEKLNSSRGLSVLKVTAQQKLTKEEMRKRDGESHTLMQIQMIYSTPTLQTRSGVSQMPQNLFPFSPAWNTFLVPLSHAHRYSERNAPPLQIFYSQKGIHSAVSRDGPDEYAWDRHSADMLQYVRLADAVTLAEAHFSLMQIFGNSTLSHTSRALLRCRAV